MGSSHVRDFPSIRKIFGGTGFQPVLAQTKACGYIFYFFPYLKPYNHILKRPVFFSKLNTQNSKL